MEKSSAKSSAKSAAKSSAKSAAPQAQAPSPSIFAAMAAKIEEAAIAPPPIPKPEAAPKAQASPPQAGWLSGLDAMASAIASKSQSFCHHKGSAGQIDALICQGIRDLRGLAAALASEGISKARISGHLSHLRKAHGMKI